MCIGYRFALQEIRLGLLELLSQFHFEVQWELMVPPLQQQGEGLGAVAEDKQQQQQQQQQQWQRDSRVLRTMNGFTLSPVGGIWVKIEPRVPAVGPAAQS
jgi:hypothetical protein